MKPFITALIDTYNQEDYIESAITSVLEQNFPASDMEIIVVDDGSTDRTPEIVRKFTPRVRLLRKENGGQASAINAGTAEAQGQIVSFLDGDDLWFPNKLSRVAAEFQKDPNIAMAYHRFCLWDVRDNSVWDRPSDLRSGDILADRNKLLSYWPAGTCSLSFRKSVLQKVMPIPEECSFMHDAYLVATTLFFGPVAAIDECLTKVRIHGRNLHSAEKAPDPGVFRRRVTVRKAMIESTRKWCRRHRSPYPRSHTLLLPRMWQLEQDQEVFRLKPPNNLTFALHLCRTNIVYGPDMTPVHRAYMWTRAAAALVLGPRHLHYMEGVRTRAKKFAARLRLAQ
jgi:glycosyltransferase involved in cell wall biosynthesis